MMGWASAVCRLPLIAGVYLQLQERLQEVQHLLEVAQASLKEAASDRDMFLRRLQQLEGQADEDAAVPRPASRLELQRQKAHATQVCVQAPCNRIPTKLSSSCLPLLLTLCCTAPGPWCVV